MKTGNYRPSPRHAQPNFNTERPSYPWPQYWVLSWNTARSHPWTVPSRLGDSGSPAKPDLGTGVLGEPEKSSSTSLALRSRARQALQTTPATGGTSSGHQLPGAVFCTIPDQQLRITLGYARVSDLGWIHSRVPRRSRAQGRHYRREEASMFLSALRGVVQENALSRAPGNHAHGAGGQDQLPRHNLGWGRPFRGSLGQAVPTHTPEDCGRRCPLPLALEHQGPYIRSQTGVSKTCFPLTSL